MEDSPACSTPRTVIRVPSRAMSLLAAVGREKLGRRLGDRDLRLGHYATMEALADAPGCTQRGISLRTGHDPSDIVALLDDLQATGLVTRTRDPEDRRRHVVSLTPAGEESLRWCRVQAAAATDEFLEPLSGPQREALEAALDILLAAHRA